MEEPVLLAALRLLGMPASSAPMLERLEPFQAAWLSGYFAALARPATGTAAPGLEPECAAAPGSGSSTKPSAPTRLLILYGTETGNALGLATRAAEQGRAAGLEVEVRALGDSKPRALEKELLVGFVTSTHGDGVPPESALRFFELLNGPTAPRLPQLRYAVLGLGDTSYEYFCRAARVLDERLQELGAQRMLARVDCDLDYDAPAARWTQQLLECVRPAESGNAAGIVRVETRATNDAARPPELASYDRNTPFPALVLENFALTGRGSSKHVRHLALGLPGSGLTFAPGDSLGVVPHNDSGLVEALLGALDASGQERVIVDGESMSFGSALGGYVEISAPSPRFLADWAECSRAAELALLTRPTEVEARRRFAREHHVLDIVRRFPVRGVDPAFVLRSLRRLTPRLYSIASSLSSTPGEVQLTVGLVDYRLHGRRCLGVASGHIAERTVEGDRLPVYVQENPSFKLPTDASIPLLMIGAGTGIAPYRAFIQEVEACGVKRPSWLVFGDRNFRTDFLYQTEWQRHVANGTLERLSVAFSRDQAEKRYVQHRLLESARDVYDWLEQGAVLYVCGDATQLAPAVHEALLAIVAEQASVSSERAHEYLRELTDCGRYQRDVY